MAWRVEIVLDESSPMLVSYMPVWAVRTARRVEAAKELGDYITYWEPEPTLTLFQAAANADGPAVLDAILDTVLEHHPRVCTLYVEGVRNSDALTLVLASRSFLYRAHEKKFTCLFPPSRLGNRSQSNFGRESMGGHG